MMNRLAACLAALILSAGAAAAGTLGSAFTGYFALGDSLSDPGNVFAASGGSFPPDPYANGRFSNGPTFADYIARQFDPGRSRNYAHGFAEAVNPGEEPLPAALALHLDEQLALFGRDAAGGAAAGSLVTLLIGANDLFGELDAVVAGSVRDPAAHLFETATVAARAVARAVAGVAEYGPAQVVVMTLPDLGTTPAYAATPLAPLASYATGVFNAALAALPGLSTATTAVSVFDTDALFARVLADPSAFGFDPARVGLPCFAAGAVPDCAGFLFADAVHPTTQGHEIIAAALAGSLAPGGEMPAPVPLPAGMPLLAAALGALALAARRRRA